MTILAQIALRFCRGYILRKIDTDEFKDAVAKTVNDKVDLPKLDEKEEKALFLAVITALIALLKRL